MLLPRTPAREVNARRPLVIVTSGLSLLRFTLNGDFSFVAPGKATMGALEDSQDLLQEAVAPYNGDVLPCSDAFAIAFRLPGALLPFQLLFLPFLGFAGASLSVPLQRLQPLLSEGSDSHGLVLYAPRLRRAQLVRASLSDEVGVLRIGPSGGEVMVSPIQLLRDNDRAWQISLLAPCRSVGVELDRSELNHLPTPPPSPPIRDPTPLVTHEQETDLPLVQESAAIPSSTSAKAPPRSSLRRRPSLVLVHNLPARLLRAYLHALFNIFFWFWNVFLKSLAVRVAGERLPRSISTIIEFALSKTAPRRSFAHGSRAPEAREASGPRGPKSVGGSTTSTSDCVARHRSVNLHDDTAGYSYGRSELLRAPLPQHTSVVTRGCSAFGPRVVLSATLVRGDGQYPPSLVLLGKTPIEQLHMTLDGAQLPPPSITSLGDDVYLVELDDATGNGSLEVSFDF